MLTEKEINKLSKITRMWLMGENDSFIKSIKNLKKVELAQLICCQQEIPWGVHVDREQVIQFQDFIMANL